MTDEKQELRNGITQDMIDTAKGRHLKVSIATLSDSNGTELQDVLVGTPSEQVLSQFERYVDKDPAKAKKLLLKGTLCSHPEIASMSQNTVLFSAAFNAAAEMLPVGKAVLKEV